MDSKQATTEEKAQKDAAFLDELRKTIGVGSEVLMDSIQRKLDAMNGLATTLGLDGRDANLLMIQIAMETAAQLVNQANGRMNELSKLSKKCECGHEHAPISLDEPVEKLITGIAKQAPALTVTVVRKS